MGGGSAQGWPPQWRPATTRRTTRAAGRPSERDDEEEAAKGQVEGSEGEAASEDCGEVQEEGRTSRHLMAIAFGLEC